MMPLSCWASLMSFKHPICFSWSWTTCSARGLAERVSIEEEHWKWTIEYRLFLSSPIHLQNFEREAFQWLLRQRRSIYDCLYLALAEALEAPMVTADRKFFQALQNSSLCNRLLMVEDLKKT